MGCGLACRDWGHQYVGDCAYRNERKVEPLAQWEKELLLGTHQIGEGEVTFHLKDGSSFTIDHLRIDSISGIASNAGVITAELFSDENKMYHIPNVLYWMVDYRF